MHGDASVKSSSSLCKFPEASAMDDDILVRVSDNPPLRALEESSLSSLSAIAPSKGHSVSQIPPLVDGLA